MTTHRRQHSKERKVGRPFHRSIDWTGFHKDWRTWLVVGLMLAAMGAYVLTLDDSVQLGGAMRSVPSTAAPAGPAK